MADYDTGKLIQVQEHGFPKAHPPPHPPPPPDTYTRACAEGKFFIGYFSGPGY